MFKPTKLLKVISIIMIVFGVLGIAGTVFSYMMLPAMSSVPGVDVAMLKEAFSPLSMVISVASGVFLILSGILGVAGKSMKGLQICGGIYTALILISIIQTVVLTGFTTSLILSFVIPVLFWWGVYQSKE